MKIPFTGSFKVAQKLLKEINKRASKNVAKTYWVENYENGREHGFHLNGGDKIVSFSEYRSSDSIVVYIGDKCTFEKGNTPSDEAYTNKQFFHPEDYNRVAKYILSIIEPCADKWVADLKNSTLKGCK